MTTTADRTIRPRSGHRLRHSAGHHQPAHRRAARAGLQQYALVIYAAKRARQINDYYNQLGEASSSTSVRWWSQGLQEKPLSIALRDSRRPSRTHRGE